MSIRVLFVHVLPSYEGMDICVDNCISFVISDGGFFPPPSPNASFTNIDSIPSALNHIISDSLIRITILFVLMC